jgi:phage terminase large subunit-like protein
MSRRVVPARWVRWPVDRLAVAEGHYFDEAAGAHAVHFIETFCRQSKGRWAGEPLRLLDWQRDFVMRLFAWKRPDGSRRFRSCYLEVAKKNGKSTLASALALLMLVADHEGAPEIYLNAVDRTQTRAVFDEAARMVKASPALARRLDCLKTLRIVDERGNGTIVANSRLVDSKDGVNAHATIFDEVHRQADRRLYEVFQYASIARSQPLHLYITTAGEDDLGLWHDLREWTERTQGPAGDDLSHFGAVYRALPEDDVDRPDVWRKANPSLGVTFAEADFAADLRAARARPADWNNFLRFRLNIIAAASDKFIDMEVWDRGAADPRPVAGRPVYAGLDLSKTRDLTALVYLAGDEAGGYDVWAKFWLPLDNIEELSRSHRVNYRGWADRGYITLTPGARVDYAWIEREIVDFARAHDLRRLCADPWMALDLLTRLQDNHGLPVAQVRQGIVSLNDPTKTLDRLIGAGRLRHGGHPILRWHASMSATALDAAGNVKLNKRRSRDKIDGIAALIDALAAASGSGQEGGDSVFNDPGYRPLVVDWGRAGPAGARGAPMGWPR